MFRSAFILVAQLLPGVVLVLYGWGFDDLPAFFINPARTGLAAAIFAGAVGAGVWGVELHPVRRGSMPVGRQSLQLGILLLLSLFLLWFLPFADRRRILTFQQHYWHNYWRYVGLLLCCAGITTRLFALKALGKYLQCVRHAATESQTGARGYLRQDSSSALFEFAVGADRYCAGI